MLIEWAGDAEVPAWRGIRTPDLVYIENADGTLELYDLGGRLGPADPDQLHNVARQARYAAARRALEDALVRLVPGGGGAG